MVDGRHIDQVPARQGDVRSNARALLAQRLFGDLDDNLLALFQEVGDQRQRRTFPVPVLVPVFVAVLIPVSVSVAVPISIAGRGCRAPGHFARGAPPGAAPFRARRFRALPPRVPRRVRPKPRPRGRPAADSVRGTYAAFDGTCGEPCAQSGCAMPQRAPLHLPALGRPHPPVPKIPVRMLRLQRPRRQRQPLRRLGRTILPLQD